MEHSGSPALVGSSASLGLLPERANDSGSTSCLVRWIVETPAGWLGAWNVEAFDAAAGIVRDAEIERQRLRIEQLRGLCKTAVGWLRDAEADRSADELQALIGDMERPGSGCVECGGPLQWRCPACRIAQSAKVAENNAGRDDGEGHCVRCGIELDDAHEWPPGFMPATSQPANVGSEGLCSARCGREKMDDLDLLEAAAKAAQLPDVRRSEHGPWMVVPYDQHLQHRRAHDWRIWNPLEDDGDALWLVAKLKLDIAYDTMPDGAGYVEVVAEWGFEPRDNGQQEFLANDGAAATRRSIVRAAASMALRAG